MLGNWIFAEDWIGGGCRHSNKWSHNPIPGNVSDVRQLCNKRPWHFQIALCAQLYIAVFQVYKLLV